MKRFLCVVPSVLMALGIVACSDDNSSEATAVQIEPGESLTITPDSVSSAAEGVSSSGAENNSSGAESSNDAGSSSSAAKPQKNEAACIWNASKGDYSVNTGFDPDTVFFAGYWYTFSDEPDGGMTQPIVPQMCAYEEPEDVCMEGLFEYCRSFCAEYRFDKGTASEIFGGMGFLVAGYEDPFVAKPVYRYGDLADWGGVCVTYAADRDVVLRLYSDENTYYDAPLGESAEFVEKCVTWDSMKAAEASKHALRIAVVMPGTDQTKGHLSVAAIGKYDAKGACEVEGFAYVEKRNSYETIPGIIVLATLSSSSSYSSSSSGAITGQCTTPEPVSNLWYGPTAADQSIYNVNTGLDNGTETSGYWFSFGDEDGDARVVWTELPTYETSIDPVVDFCKGICGTFDFTNEGVTGVGFNVAGIVSWEHEVPDFADVSAWGGLCVTYASEADLVVAMSTDTTYAYVDNLVSMPKITLPRSLETNTVCSNWDDFFLPAGISGNTAHVASLLFAVRGKAGERSKFNIIGVGMYADARNVCKQGAEPFVAGKN